MFFLSCFLPITLYFSSTVGNSHPLIDNEEKVNETKMYNKMYWNDIVQLIFSYTHIPLCLFDAFLSYTTYKMELLYT